jgi:hypothetical protein
MFNTANLSMYLIEIRDILPDNAPARLWRRFMGQSRAIMQPSATVIALPSPKRSTAPDEYAKAAVILAVLSGMMSRIEACNRYTLSSDEFSLWETAYDHDGIIGLRTRSLSAWRRAASIHRR